MLAGLSVVCVFLALSSMECNINSHSAAVELMSFNRVSVSDVTFERRSIDSWRPGRLLCRAGVFAHLRS